LTPTPSRNTYKYHAINYSKLLMEEYQGFRVAGTTTDVQKIYVDKIDGQNIIFWEDIERVFPRVQHVQNGEFVVKLLRDLNQTTITPHCIKHYPGIVLDVVLSATAEHVPIDFPLRILNLALDLVVTGLTMLLRHSAGILSSTIRLASTFLARLLTTIASIVTFMSSWICTVHSMRKLEGFEGTVNRKLDNYELLEYTILRLFIVLPETSTSWDPASIIRTKFRLHFICECGEHTKPTGSKIPHHLHLANQEGYVINKPTEFFKKYGPFLMLMLKMIKLGTRIAGYAVPALKDLKLVNALDYSKSTIDSVTSEVIKGVDYSLAYLEKNRASIPKSDGVNIGGDDLVSYLAGV
ncbi:hypothetical protein BGX21_005063, partial [Mortierella sp. AD011]